MKRNRALFWICLVIAVFSALLLITGSPWLVKPLGGQTAPPLGNVTTALGCIALSLMPWFLLRWWGKKTTKWYWSLQFTTVLAFGFSIFWWPVGRMLSGNWSNLFLQRPIASKWFWNYSYGLVSLSFMLLLLICITRILNGKNEKP
ncbi:MAG: hypothetical protein AAGF96_14770 [Bacteroidota bacterium]